MPTILKAKRRFPQQAAGTVFYSLRTVWPVPYTFARIEKSMQSILTNSSGILFIHQEYIVKF
ncbi:hypothetical protein SATMO3_48120 [Sporomusa aerivorans]